jgi:hypothetical protein
MNDQSILIKFGQISRERIRKIDKNKIKGLWSSMKRKVLYIFVLYLKKLCANLVKPKYGRVHAKTKRTDFLERMMETGSIEDWLQEFRIHKSVFLYICDLVRDRLCPKPNPLSKPNGKLSVEFQVAVALYRLASCGDNRFVGNVFGIHLSTVRKCLFR